MKFDCKRGLIALNEGVGIIIFTAKIAANLEDHLRLCHRFHYSIRIYSRWFCAYRWFHRRHREQKRFQCMSIKKELLGTCYTYRSTPSNTIQYHWIHHFIDHSLTAIASFFFFVLEIATSYSTFNNSFQSAILSHLSARRYSQSWLKILKVILRNYMKFSRTNFGEFDINQQKIA